MTAQMESLKSVLTFFNNSQVILHDLNTFFFTDNHDDTLVFWWPPLSMSFRTGMSFFSICLTNHGTQDLNTSLIAGFQNCNWDTEHYTFQA